MITLMGGTKGSSWLVPLSWISQMHLCSLECSEPLRVLSSCPTWFSFSLTGALLLFSLKKHREAWVLKTELCLVSGRKAGQGAWLTRALNEGLCLRGDPGPPYQPHLVPCLGLSAAPPPLSDLGFGVAPLTTTPSRWVMAFLNSLYRFPIPLGK